MWTSAYEGKGLGKETVLLWEGIGATEGQRRMQTLSWPDFISPVFRLCQVPVIYLMKVSERTNPML